MKTAATARGADVVVVGGGLAGATCALALRELGFAGSITIVGDEQELPYERPPLTKAYLRGEAERDSVFVRDAEAYAEASIEVITGCRVSSLHADGRCVVLDDGNRLWFENLVIATGAEPQIPSFEGRDLDGVHVLRTLADADRLRERAATSSRAVVVGAGFIGCEAGAVLRQLGLDVVVVDPGPGPMHAQLGPVLSEVVAGWHRERGVEILRSGVRAVVGGGSVEGVETDDGRRIAAELVLIGTGVRPRTEWLHDAPLHLTHGAVDVDPDGRTSLDGVWACGDVASPWDPQRREHVPGGHWDLAYQQGRRVACSIARVARGAEAPATYWTEQYGHTIHYAGGHGPDDRHIVRSESDLLVFWLRRDVVTAIAAADAQKRFRAARELVGRRVRAEALADLDLDLSDLIRSSDLEVPA